MMLPHDFGPLLFGLLAGFFIGVILARRDSARWPP